MNPLAAGLRQPDPRSCGAASMVMARLLRDRAEPDAGAFRDEVLACHRRLTALRDRDRGRWQVPWPRAIGTPPWAVARELTSLTGLEHDTHLVRWREGAAYDRLAASGGALYVGSAWLPRHVVLALACDGPLRCYEPSSGRVVTLDRAAFTERRLRLAGWDVAWLVVSPRATRSRTG